jgi:hypothetical protein
MKNFDLLKKVFYESAPRTQNTTADSFCVNSLTGLTVCEIEGSNGGRAVTVDSRFVRS